MAWHDPELLAPGGGLVTILTTLGILRKKGKLPFGKSNNGNGHKTQHKKIDELMIKHDSVFKDLSEMQIKQNMILEAHETRLNDGKKEFKEVQASIHNIDVSLAVLASKAEKRRSSD